MIVRLRESRLQRPRCERGGRALDREGVLYGAERAIGFGNGPEIDLLLVDGFAHLTAAQAAFLGRLVARSGECVVALCHDPDGGASFAHTRAACEALRSLPVAWEEERLDGTPRFESPDLAELERALFTSERASSPPGTIEILASPGEYSRLITEGQKKAEVTEG